MQGENADIKRLLGQQEDDFKEYRARVEKLEEQICSGADQGINMLQVHKYAHCSGTDQGIDMLQVHEYAHCIRTDLGINMFEAH